MTSSTSTRIGQLWTDSVAYVALFAGAGLSIAGNVANVVRTRGAQVDTLDVVLAVAFPALVVLMVEVFVSSRWRGLSWPMQVLRWLGTVSIGAVAMRVSWVHLNELMLSRGQAQDVATLGPLAIDFLAIMATALILAGRGRAVVLDIPVDTAADILAKRQDETDRLLARTAPVLPSAHVLAGVQADTPSIADEASTWLDSLNGSVLDDTTTPAFPLAAGSVSNAVKPESVPADAADLIMAWAAADGSDRPSVGQADALVAADLGVTARTARRWRQALLSS